MPRKIGFFKNHTARVTSSQHTDTELRATSSLAKEEVEKVSLKLNQTTK